MSKMNLPTSDVLVIKAKGGFGNRILSAATGVVLAQLIGRSPLIDWRDGEYLPVGVDAYPLLFEAAVQGNIADLDDRMDVSPRIWAGHLSQHPTDIIHRHFPKDHSNPLIYRKLSISLARPVVPEPIAVFWSYLPKMARLARRVRRCSEFRSMTMEDVVRAALERHFRPNPRVRSEVEALFAGRRRPIIGVHIRYTDRKVSLDRIFSEVTRLRRAMPESTVFLATDNHWVQDEFCKRFAGVFVIEKILGDDANSLHEDVVLENPLREAENALIDMWALANCDWLVHSKNSTFSVAASLIGGIPHSRQRDIDRWNAKVVVKRWVQRYA